ncbi:MAG: sulfur oxidation c-type cytochrome SoxX [Rhodospirillales bacterium]|nr:sulfur oxidation c-type cytochrome SoxX [Rhodospirillales bacterium]
MRLTIPVLLLAAAAILALPEIGAAQQKPTAAGSAAVPALTGSALAGQKLAFSRKKGNCLACHTMRGSDVPSNVGPELVNLKALFPHRKDLVAIVTNEQARNPQTVMPPFGKNLILSAKEIQEVVDFLYTL